MQKIENLIDGKLIAPVSGQYLDNFNPAEGKVYSLIPDSDQKDVDLAVKAAQRAFPEWSMMAVEKRSAVLSRLADLIDRDFEKLAQAESLDQGKPVKLAR